MTRFLFLLLLTLAPVLARAGEPPTAPILRIETGMHTADLEDGSVDDAGRFAVTCADDKTVRVWNLRNGELLNILRPPIGAGDEGKLGAAQIAPDGQTIACGGSTGAQWNDGNYSIYLFDRATGALSRRIGGLPGDVQCLSYSADGQRLAVGLRGEELRVFRASDGALLGQKAGDDVFAALDFARDGHLASARADGVVRVYDTQYRLVAEKEPLSGLKIGALRFSPDAKKIAVVGVLVKSDAYPASQIAVLDAKSLTPLWKSRLENEGTLGFYSDIAWDGGALIGSGIKSRINGLSVDEWVALTPEQKATLLRGGRSQQEFDRLPEAQRKVRVDVKTQSFVRRWATPGAAAFRDVDTESINRLVALREGAVLWSGDAGALGVLERDGRMRWKKSAVTANFQSRDVETLRVSRDGLSVGFAFLDGKSKLYQNVVSAGAGDAPQIQQQTAGAINSRFNVAARGFQLAATESLATPIQVAPGLQIEDALLGAPRLNGRPLDFDDFEFMFGLSLAPDGQSFAIGTNLRLLRFDRAGRAQWETSVPAGADAVNISGDGRLLVAAFDDGTIRWYRFSDGAELLAFFPHADRKRWVLWTPQGYYDCSLGGEDLIGWHLNNGGDEAADFFSASRYQDTFYRPDIISRVLKTLDVEQARQGADKAAGKGALPAPNLERVIETQSPPVVRLVKPLDAIQTSETKLTLRYALRTPSGEPVTAVQVLVNGRPVATENNLNVAPGKEGEIERTIEVTLPARDCEVGLLAINRFSFSQGAFLKVWRGQGRGIRLENAAPGETVAPASLGKLWVLAVGVEKYDRSLPQLSYSIDDAEAICKTMQAQDKARGGPYNSVETKLLADADRSTILGGLKWLQQNVGQDDRAVIFLAGHGTNTAQGYYFLPSNCARDDYDTDGLAFSEFINRAPTIKGQVLFLVDTCRAANIMGGAEDVTSVLNRLSQAGKGWSVMAASSGNQTAQESGKWGHGAFTRAILEGFEGQGDAASADGFIYLKKLSSYVDIRVSQMTGGSQTPAFTSFNQSEQLLGHRLKQKVLVTQLPNAPSRAD